MRLLVATLLLFAAPEASAQTVTAGIAAWEKGDAATAVAIWRPLAAKGDADAQFNLAQAYKLGRGVPVDLARTQRLYEQAARQGHVDAQTSLGLLLFGNGDRAAALRWLKAGAEAGEPRALLVYGTALFNGDGVPRDAVTAYAMVSRAAAQGLEPATTTLREMDAGMSLTDRRAGVAKAIAWTKPRPKVAKSTSRPPPSAVTRDAAGGWRIQLGAFSESASADALFSRLRAGGALAGKQGVLVPSGAMTRLQVGSYLNRPEAAAACKALMARGQACFPVPAR